MGRIILLPLMDRMEMQVHNVYLFFLQIAFRTLKNELTLKFCSFVGSIFLARNTYSAYLKLSANRSKGSLWNGGQHMLKSTFTTTKEPNWDAESARQSKNKWT